MARSLPSPPRGNLGFFPRHWQSPLLFQFQSFGQSGKVSKTVILAAFIS